MARWSLVSEASPALRRWDDEFVVHHALSNDTHRLSGAAGCILQLLAAAHSRDIQELARGTGITAAEVELTLQALAELELVAWC